MPAPRAQTRMPNKMLLRPWARKSRSRRRTMRRKRRQIIPAARPKLLLQQLPEARAMVAPTLRSNRACPPSLRPRK
eukprot:2766309-Lingulodinium_polyedra.AAC.1